MGKLERAEDGRGEQILRTLTEAVSHVDFSPDPSFALPVVPQASEARLALGPSAHLSCQKRRFLNRDARLRSSEVPSGSCLAARFPPEDSTTSCRL